MVTKRKQPSWHQIFALEPLLLGIVVLSFGLKSLGVGEVARASVKPALPSPPEPPGGDRSPLPADPLLYSNYLPIELQPNLISVPSDLPAVVVEKKSAPVHISRSPHLDLLNADNYLVSVQPAADFDVSRSLQDRAIQAKSTVALGYSKTRELDSIATSQQSSQSAEAASNLMAIEPSPPSSWEQSSSPHSHSSQRKSSQRKSSQHKSLAGLKSKIVTPMKSRLHPEPPNGRHKRRSRVGKASPPANRHIATAPIETTPQTIDRPMLRGSGFANDRVEPLPTTPQIDPGLLAYAAPKPNIFARADAGGAILEESAEDAKRRLEGDRLAMLSNLTITDPSFLEAVDAPPTMPKQQIPLSPQTKISFGARVLEASDLADTVNPLFDLDDKTKDKDPLMISRFGSRAGIYYLVAGSGVGVRYQFSPSLEGSVGILARSANDGINAQNNRSNQGIKSNTSLNNNRPTASGGFEIPFDGYSLADSYGGIAQLTYAPAENLKVGLAYVYAYNVNPEIGSDSANNTGGVNSSIGVQSFWRASPNFALGGWMNFNRNSNPEIDKNIVSWAVTAGIPDLGGKGNLAGIIIGQEPRTIFASNLAEIDRGAAWHLEGFYKIAIDKDLSITPAITYITGPNIDNIAPGKSDIVGAIGINYRF